VSRSSRAAVNRPPCGLAVLLLLLVSGCYYPKAVNPPRWTYDGAVRSFNLTGDRQREHASLWFIDARNGIEVMPSGERLILLEAGSPYLHVALLYPNAAIEDKKPFRLDLSTQKGQVEAWLIRSPPITDDPLNNFRRFAHEFVRRAPDQRRESENTLSMRGDVRIEGNGDHLTELNFDLVTENPISNDVTSHESGPMGATEAVSKAPAAVIPRPAHVKGWMIGYVQRWYWRLWPLF
jgi:hypothetical protein